MWAEMYINLDERPLTNAAEAMDLSGLDDKNVTRAGFEFLMRASLKRQIFLADAVHPAGAPAEGSSKHTAITSLARRKRHAELNQGQAGRAGDVAAVELHGAADDAEDRVEVGSEVEHPAHGQLIADPHLRPEPR